MVLRPLTTHLGQPNLEGHRRVAGGPQLKEEARLRDGGGSCDPSSAQLNTHFPGPLEAGIEARHRPHPCNHDFSKAHATTLLTEIKSARHMCVFVSTQQSGYRGWTRNRL